MTPTQQPTGTCEGATPAISTDTLAQALRERIMRDYYSLPIGPGRRIVTPGKFEGEPIFAPYFWECALDGMADWDDGKLYKFDITLKDREDWPELAAWLGRRHTLRLHEDGQGFVRCY